MSQQRPHYILTFDGGSRGNPGEGYGSYELRTCDDRARIERREYGQNVTNNEAEYRTLIEGLADTLATLQRAGKDPRTYRVRVQGDSQLVIRQLNGEYQIKHPAMRTLHGQVRDLAGRFAAVEYVWHPRARSVETLGH